MYIPFIISNGLSYVDGVNENIDLLLLSCEIKFINRLLLSPHTTFTTWYKASSQKEIFRFSPHISMEDGKHLSKLYVSGKAFSEVHPKS